MTPEAPQTACPAYPGKVADFLCHYCGEYGGGQCCMKRCGLRHSEPPFEPGRAGIYTASPRATDAPERGGSLKNAMEERSTIWSARFSFTKDPPLSPERDPAKFSEFLASASLSAVTNA